MQALLPSLMPFVAVVAVGLLYYRRIRRQFGRQPWQAKRHGARLVLLAIGGFVALRSRQADRS